MQVPLPEASSASHAVHELGDKTDKTMKYIENLPEGVQQASLI